VVFLRAVEDILLWRTWEKSLVIVVTVSAAYLMLEWTGVNLLKLLANSLLCLIVASFVYNNVATFAGGCAPRLELFLRFVCPRLHGSVTRLLG
jgi:Reticulon